MPGDQDRQTTYLTFLPPMEEGFHAGYHTAPGIVCDHNRRPREWLESLARFLKTPGNDVSYSIPDVLCAEQQLRRLLRLTPERALAHQTLLDYRGVLAVLLLWDTWPRNDTWPILELVRLPDNETAFCASVSSALSPTRADDGLWVYTLRAAKDPAPARPLALLSRAMAIVPAAAPGDLSALLPPAVTWYDRAARRFTDPCPSITARDAAFLAARLQLLCQLNEQSSLQSPLYDPEASLCGALRSFAGDLAQARGAWRARLEEGDATALNDLLVRLLAVYCLEEKAAPVQKETLHPGQADPSSNPLLRVLLGPETPTGDAALTLWTLESAAFACQSSFCLLEPARAPGEEAAMARLSQEIALLREHDAAWRQRAVETLKSLAASTAGRPGLWSRMPDLLASWAEELARIPAAPGVTLELTYPLKSRSDALCSLLSEALSLTDGAAVREPFSDILLLIDGQPPFATEALNGCCRVTLGVRTCYALPPLSAALCRQLMDAAQADEAAAPRLDGASLRFVPSADGTAIEASFRIVRRARRGEQESENSVTLRRIYILGSSAQSGTALVIPAAQAPYVVVWPNVRLAPDAWQRYFVHAHRPQDIGIWALGQDGWRQGERRQGEGHAWQNVCVERFPAFVVLSRGALSLGALVNDIPHRLIRHEPPATVSVDFGSISTTVMLRQDSRVQPAALPQSLHCALLSPLPGDGGRLRDEFLPVHLPEHATCYSLMDLFSDRPELWREVLCDGHIYYRGALADLLKKSASALYYDLKWSAEDYALRCLRLFLKQVMLQASLCARLGGSSSVSWRVSMPNAMPLGRQEAYLEMVRALAHEVAGECGLPLTPGCPAVCYASENQADGLYFLSRSEVSSRGGYLTLDIGGSTADLSLWLGGESHAAVSHSLLLGCREMLFDSLSQWHAQDLKQDLSAGSKALQDAVLAVTDAFAAEASTAHGRRKCMLLLDDLFASYAGDIRDAMAAARSLGYISHLESLLLFEIGYLFFLCGEMLANAYEDGSLSPLLSRQMTLCIAGNGGQLLRIFSDDQLTRLCSLALGRLQDGHPLRVLLPVQSRHPKQEVTRGLLARDDTLLSAIHPQKAPSVAAAPKDEDLLGTYLTMFYSVFPQAADRLMPRAFEERDGIRLTATARMEVDTIFSNEKPCHPGDDMAMSVRCLSQLKRLWRL